ATWPTLQVMARRPPLTTCSSCCRSTLASSRTISWSPRPRSTTWSRSSRSRWTGPSTRTCQLSRPGRRLPRRTLRPGPSSALPTGIDRDHNHETFWLGTATPGSVVPADNKKDNPGPEWRKKWAVLDLNQANEMLDKLGLDKKHSEGYRQRTDGKGRLSIVVTTWGGQFVQYTRISEMIRDQWKKIGIDLQVQEVERSLGQQRSAANETQMW